MSEPNSGYMSPDEITNKAFDTKRRGGVDPEAVKRHLAAAAATVHGLLAERASLSEQIVALQDDLAAAKSDTSPLTELDEEELTERLGKDAARVLAEARAAAADRIAEAETQADDIRAAAEEVFAERSMRADQEADRIRQSAESTKAERTAEAEQAAAQIIARAEADAESLRSNIAGERQSVDADAARIVREAELTRRQILEDLARRRSSARRQIEQLRAGRERLLASHETVRRALDDISEELTISMSEARAAAETAGHSVPDTTIEELEAEIETARLTGLLDTGPLPVVAPPAVPPSARGTEDADEPRATEVAAEASPPDVNPEQAEDESVPDTQEPTVPDVSDTSAPAESSTKPADTSSSAPGLADVVQLDRARNDVDTATHPATGRDSSASRGNTASVAAEPATPTLEAVEPLPEAGQPDSAGDDLESDSAVDDLFASLRSTTAPTPKKSGAKASEKAVAKKQPNKKSTAKKSTAKKASSSSGSKPAVVPDVDSSDLARRLKRVLADEQSKAMSRIKAADVLPEIDVLLGDEATHRDGYWTEVVGHVEGVSEGDDEIRRPVEDLVGSIRHRVGEALEEAGDDSESAVAALRSVYREVKTQRVTECAADVCQLAASRPSERS